MKNFHPLLFLLFLSVTAIFSCSGTEDDPQPESPDSVKPGLFENELEVSAPAAMVNSEDAYAKMAANYLSSVNSFNSYSSAFYPPENAQRTSTPVSAANARIAADFLVYQWTYNGRPLAYQYSEQDGKHIFEVFFQEDEAEFLRYYYAEEDTDGRSGMFQIFNTTGKDPSAVLVSWRWEILDNGSANFVYDLANGGFRYEVTANEDQSGTIEITTKGTKTMFFEWDSEGNGSWEKYDASGQLTETGEWTV